MDDDDTTLTTARDARETAFALFKALRLMEEHALEAELDELAFLIGVAGEAARELVEAANAGLLDDDPEASDERDGAGSSAGDGAEDDVDDPGDDPVH